MKIEGLTNPRSRSTVLAHPCTLVFPTILIIRLIQKIMQVSSILFVTCFVIVGILSLTYPFMYLQ
jgi:hypothetical protein